MTIALDDALDPRLRSLLALSADQARLDAARPSGFTGASALESTTGANYVASVLVQLRTDAVPASIARHRYVRLVDRIYSVSLPFTDLPALRRDPDVVFIEAAQPMEPALDSSVKETRADKVWPAAGQPGFDGTGVLVGIIDFGMDFTLDDFRDDQGRTRLEFLWDQNLASAGGERSPARYGYGVEYSAAQIDAANASASPFALVRHAPAPKSHGTHVAGIAAGNGRSKDANHKAGVFVGVAPQARIVFVQPRTGSERSFTDSVSVAEAIAYVFEKATALGLPCVINMSLGQNGGSHDGESIVERAIDRWLEEPGRAFVSAAGNEHVWRGHAGGALPKAGDTRDLTVTVGGRMPVPGGGFTPQGLDTTPNRVEVWYSSRDRFRVAVRSPGGEVVGPVDPGQDVPPAVLTTGEMIVVISDRFSRLNGDAQIYVEVFPPVGGAVTSGDWVITLEAIEARDGRFDAWIERDVRDVQNDPGAQAFFAGTDFDPTRTLGTPATSRRGLVVANYDHRSGSVNDSSSRGPTRDGRRKPDLAAPGTNIKASCSRPTDPSSPGVRVGKTGTSMSAPHVAGVVALMLQRNPRLTAAQIAKVLVATARSPAAVDGFDPGWGFGMIDAAAAVAAIG